MIKPEFKTIPVDSKLKVGDVFLFVASNLEQGKEVSDKAWGSAIVSDFHASDNSYNIVIWEYKGVPKVGVGKGAILDMLEAGSAMIFNANGVSKERVFGILGGHRDQNLIDFTAELKEDLGDDAGKKPVFLVIKEIKESNVLDVLREGGMKLEVNKETGKLKAE